MPFSLSDPKSWPAPFRRINRNAFRFLLLALTGIGALASLVLPIALRPDSYPLQVGNVSEQDILAPSNLTYESQVLTQQARDDAQSRVSPVFLPADPSITRRQIERLRTALAYIATVRLDSYATPEQKMSDLNRMSDLALDADVATRILALSENRWQAVQQEAIAVLEQTMRPAIREDRLNDARRAISTLISFTLPEDQAAIVNDLVYPFVVPNSLYSPEGTAEARLEAAAAVEPVSRTYRAGETVALRGQVINAATWEALQEFGLVRPVNRAEDILSATGLVVLLATFVSLYFLRRRIPPMDDLRSLVLIAAVFLLFLVGARLIIPNRAVVPYIFPLPAFGLTVAALFNLEIGLVFSLVLSILAAFGLPNSLDLTLFYLLSSLIGVLALGRARRIVSFFWAGIAVGAAGTAVVLAYRLGDSVTDWLGIATLSGAAFFSGIASASLTLLFQFLFAQLLGLTTALQLLEVSRPDHPLLQHVLRAAPGTYQHSLQVANLAEQAAESIGADTLLVRVGAIYHDAGKAANPQFFVENQPPGQIDSHDDLDPADVAAVIIQHVQDGLVMARKHRLPPRVQDFIKEHHGTLLARYQYTRAVEAAGSDPSRVDAERFRYPGPRPRSRETALLMLADGVEARARAENPRDEVELRALIKRVFDFYQKEGQLEDTRLTLRDLSLAADSFASTLRGTYHPRIKYPELKTTPLKPATGAPETTALPADISTEIESRR